jgi:hypothetical protein
MAWDQLEARAWENMNGLGRPMPNTDSQEAGGAAIFHSNLKNEATDFIENKGSRLMRLRNEPTERDRVKGEG